MAVMAVLWVLLLSFAFTGSFGASAVGGDFCGAGYYSVYGRLWTLGSLTVPTAVNGHVLNLCGSQTTTCGAAAVVCGGSFGNVTIARRDSLDISPQSNATSLVVSYANGLLCPTAQGTYRITIRFNCGDVPQVNTWTVRGGGGNGPASCTYFADVWVPSSMCALSPAAPAPFCEAGYVSPSGRRWVLSTINGEQVVANASAPGVNIDYKFDFCGTRSGFLTCGTGAVACADSNSLGLRTSWDIIDANGNDTTLAFTYSYGAQCGAGLGVRRIYVLAYCGTATTPVSFNIVEVSTCRFEIIVNVPSTMCVAGSGTTPVPVPPFCEPYGYNAGYYNWSIGNLLIGNAEASIYDYVLNPCGTITTPCGQWSAGCQEQNSGSISLGMWTTWDVLNSDYGVLSVQYNLGAICPNGNGRTMLINFRCTGYEPVNITVDETSTCHYVFNVDVPYSMCGYNYNQQPYPDYCLTAGLYNSGRRWKLYDYNPQSIDATNDWTFNLCGHHHTTCHHPAAVCQEPQSAAGAAGTGVSVGNPFYANIRKDLSNSNTLVVNYPLGDVCNHGVYSEITVTFICQDRPLETIPGFVVNEPTLNCHYTATVYVPTTMCPTAEAPVIYDWCVPNYYGYYSPTGRLWSLYDLSASLSYRNYDIHLDVCGKNPTPCAESAVVCQETGPASGYSIGNRYHATIVTDELSDGVLVVSYALGDNCGGTVGDRSVKVYYHCVINDWEFEMPNMTFQEVSTCRYRLDVWIPEYGNSNYLFCYTGWVTQPPSSSEGSTYLPFCYDNGYVDWYGVQWNLAGFNPETPDTLGYEIVFNLCGDQPNACGDYATICQERPDYNWALGYTWDGQVDTFYSDRNQLVVTYMGEWCDAIRDERKTFITFSCVTPYVPYMTISESSTCRYHIDVHVPGSMCTNYTYEYYDPLPLPSFCTSGYVSPTGRIWALSNFIVDYPIGSYEYILDICGGAPIDHYCDSNTVLCQQSDNGSGYSLGARWSYSYLGGTDDLTFSVLFGNGDICNGSPRQIQINFKCITGTYTSGFTVTESPTCHYTANINVPPSLCPLPPNVPVQPWCQTDGYYSVTQRGWFLNDYAPESTTYYYNDYETEGVVALNLCGNQPNGCPYQAAACFMTGAHSISLGSRYTWDINTTAANDGTLAVDYVLGDWCAEGNTDWTFEVQLECNNDPYLTTPYIYIEYAPYALCHMIIHAYVLYEDCYVVGTTVPPSQQEQWQPAYCNPGGYTSPTGRVWDLTQFGATIQGVGSKWEFSPCPNDVTTCGQTGWAILCEISGPSWYDLYEHVWNPEYNLVVVPVDDLTITISLGGDYCLIGGYYREGFNNLTFHCSDNATNLVIHESTTCADTYSISVNVPTAYCKLPTAPPLTIPEPVAPWCQPGGYFSPGGVLWKLADYAGPADQEGNAAIALNLCGNHNTFCDSETVICQEYNTNGYYKLGERWTWNLVPGNNDPSQLVVVYGGGDLCYTGQARAVYIFFHCSDAQPNLFHIQESWQDILCIYRLDVAVPLHMCQIQSPTGAPPPALPSYCQSNGYLSSTGRQWRLGHFAAAPKFDSYEWTLDLCGVPDSTFQCPNNIVMCQSGWELGLRSTSFINRQLSTDTTLVVQYDLGDWCGVAGYDRQAIIRFHCTDAGSNFTVVEGPTCVYTADINVPTIYCASTGIIAQPPAPYCKESGYYLNGRTWHLSKFTMMVPELYYVFVLDPCNNNFDICSYDSVLCQEFDLYDAWSMGSRSQWNIDTYQSTSDTLVVNYGLGDECVGYGYTRETTVYFNCVDITVGSPYDLLVYENTTCHYFVEVNIGTANCPQTSPPPAIPDWCSQAGYRSQTNRIWTLRDLEDDSVGLSYYNYVLNLCGDSSSYFVTDCPDDSVLCQVYGDAGGYNLGSRSDWGVVTPLPNDTTADLTLRVQYINGEGLWCDYNRITNIAFHCTNNLTNPFTVNESPICTYNVDVKVPLTMCQTGGTLSSPPPYCTPNGYLAKVGTNYRVWQLADYDPNDNANDYDYIMNLCGKQRTSCGEGAVICQEAAVLGGNGWNLGNRWTWTVLPTSTDKVLVVAYGLGDPTSGCPGNRHVVVYFHCQPEDSNINFSHFVVTELPTDICHYNVTANVPAHLCQPGQATTPPVPAPAWCTTGYESDSGRVWQLSQFVIDAAPDWQYTLNLCGLWNTVCDSSSVICQSSSIETDAYYYSAGDRSTGLVNREKSNDTALLIEYSLGDDCGGKSRMAKLTFHCGGDTGSYSVRESPQCTYNFDFYVPESMCVMDGPTGAPDPVADWCDYQYGYLSPWGRLWTLSSFTASSPTNSYNYVLDLCGNQPTTCTRTETVVCQEVNEAYGYNLAVRSTFQIRPESTDTTLIVDYGLGDYCNSVSQYDRTVRLYLICQDGGAGFFTVSEYSTCHYNVTITVPTALCQQASPTGPPLPAAAYCTKAGYTSPSGRIWRLKDIAIADTENDYDYELNLCGTTPTPCAPSTVVCQATPGGGGYNLAARGTHYIDPASDDKTLIVQYALGENTYCDQTNYADRRMVLYFHCTDQQYTTFVVSETSQCVYRGDINLPSKYCSTQVPTTVHLPDFCYSQGLSTQGRYWTLQKFFPEAIQGTYDFHLDLCGNARYECGVKDANGDATSAVCQEESPQIAYSLGNRANYTFLPSTPDQLVIEYFGGDYCAVIGAQRTVIVTLNCTDTGYSSIVEAENTTCHYTLNVQVPSTYCSHNPPPPTATPPAGVDFCAPAGLKTATNNWNLNGYSPFDVQGTSDFVLDICGDIPNNCPGISAVCQEVGETLGYSLGAKDNYTYDVSTPDTLFIHYLGGDWCAAINDTRQAWVYIHCSDVQTQSYTVTETTPCNFTVNIYGPTSICQFKTGVTGEGAIKESGNSNLSSGAVAGITVGVVAVAAVGSVAGGLKLYKMRKIRRFQAQID